MIRELQPVGILEMVRTGVVAIGRGIRILDADYEPPMTSAVKADANGYQVYGV